MATGSGRRSRPDEGDDIVGDVDGDGEDEARAPKVEGDETDIELRGAATVGVLPEDGAVAVAVVVEAADSDVKTPMEIYFRV